MWAQYEGEVLGVCPSCPFPGIEWACLDFALVGCPVERAGWSDVDCWLSRQTVYGLVQVWKGEGRIRVEWYQVWGTGVGSVGERFEGADSLSSAGPAE